MSSEHGLFQSHLRRRGTHVQPILFVLAVAIVTGCGSSSSDKTKDQKAEAPDTGVVVTEAAEASGAVIPEAAPGHPISIPEMEPDEEAAAPEGQPSAVYRPDAETRQEAATAARLDALQRDKYDDTSQRWRRFRTHRFDREMTEEQRRLLEQLEAIGYVSGSVEAPEMMNVTIHDRGRAYEGLNLYTSGHGPVAILMDMDGNVLHQWSYSFSKVWPDYPVEEKRPDHWRRVHLYDNGDVLAVYGGLGIAKLDKDSNLIWANPNRAHHEAQVLPNGNILVLTREAHVVPRIDPEKPIQEDFIALLDPDGNEIRRVSLLECFENSDAYRYILENREKPTGDIFHTNTLKLLDGRIADKIPAFRAGNILTSMLNLDAIAVVDLERQAIVWAYQGNFYRQHDPQILDNGHLLLFDNNREGTGQSGVQEYDPVTMKIVWEYRGTEAEPFYTRSCGAAQRLPNGNTLMTESDNGRAIEVTPEKEIVWEFYNPARAGEKGEYIATLFEMQRLDPAFPIGWIEPQGGK